MSLDNMVGDVQAQTAAGYGRGLAALRALLGTGVIGLLTSDRWAAYDKWPLWRRQICWALLKRDFQKLVDRGGAAAPLGEALLRIERRVFEEWHLFRGGTFGRRALQNHLGAEGYEFERLLEAGCACADRKAAAFCANLLALLPAVRSDRTRSGCSSIDLAIAPKLEPYWDRNCVWTYVPA